MLKKITFLVVMLLTTWHGYSQEQAGVTLKINNIFFSYY